MNIVYHTYISLRYLLVQSYLNDFFICYRILCHRLWHKIQDELEEERLSKSGAAFGSTKRGIAYAYSDKYRKKTIRLGDLPHLDEENVQARLKTMLEAKNLELAGCYPQEPMSLSALLSWCRQKAAKYAPYITDTGASLDHVVGVLKAYSTCVGAGPFVAEKL